MVHKGVYCGHLNPSKWEAKLKGIPLGSTQIHKRVCGIMEKNWLSESGLFIHIPGYPACEFKPGGNIW